MRTIGLIGGMSWESTVIYYQLLNRGTRDRLGGLHSAKLIMVSMDFAEIAALQSTGDWNTATQHMTNAALKLQNAGADCVLICSNTMHKMADDVSAVLNIPLIHIVDVVGNAIKTAQLKRPLLLGTSYTMEQDFLTDHLRTVYELDVLVPNEIGRAEINTIIYQELCHGVITPKSRDIYLGHIRDAKNAAADCVIFGCTEIGLLLDEKTTPVPAFDTTYLHTKAALDFALSK